LHFLCRRLDVTCLANWWTQRIFNYIFAMTDTPYTTPEEFLIARSFLLNMFVEQPGKWEELLRALVSIFWCVFLESSVFFDRFE
jgi:hypothetical protein